MDKTVKKFIDDVYRVPLNCTLYKTYSFDQCCYILTCAFQIICNQQLMVDGHIIDKYRHAYRQTLKEAYRFCHKDKREIPIISEEVIRMAREEIERNVTFNLIRNGIDQFNIERMDILVDGNNIEFVRKETNKCINSQIYAKFSDIYDLNFTHIERFNNKFIKFISNSSNLRHYNILEQIPDKTILDKYFNFAYKKQKSDFYYDDDYKFLNYSVDEFVKVYSYLISLSIMEINYHISFVLNSNAINEIRKNNPIIVIKKDEVIERISKYTKISNSIIANIIDDLIYNPDFHANLVTIFQPLFEIENKIYFSPFQVYASEQVEKMTYLLKKDIPNLITRLASDREKIMTKDLKEFIYSSGLEAKNNIMLYSNESLSSEIDIAIYDQKNHYILLCELKWYTKGDGEKDHKKIDSKINEEISKRILRQDIAITNKQQLANYFKIKEDFDIGSCIISMNYPGSDFVHNNLPVFDVNLFKEGLIRYNFNISLLLENYEQLINDIIDESGFYYDNKKIMYGGYNITMPLLFEKFKKYNI